MGVLGSIAGFVLYKNMGSKAGAPKTVAEARQAVPINAGSRCVCSAFPARRRALTNGAVRKNYCRCPFCRSQHPELN
jgi:hypothetical protein